MTDLDADELRYLLRDGQHLREASLTGGQGGSREYTGEYAWDGRIWAVQWRYPTGVMPSRDDLQHATVAAEDVNEENAPQILQQVAALTVRDEGGWPSLLAHGGASETLAAATNAAQERYGEAVRACLPVYGQQTVYELREVLKGMMRDYLARLSAPITEVTYDAKVKVCGNSLALPVDLRTASRLGIERGDTVVVTIRRKQQ